MDTVLQYWLLNLATNFPVPFQLLPPVLDNSDEQPTALNVRSLRGFSLDWAVNRLVELAAANLIEFTHSHEKTEPRIVPSGEVLRLVSLGETHDLSFKLTTAGGEEWEKMARPCWDEMDDGFAEVIGSDGGLVRWTWTFFSQNYDRLMAVIGWFPWIEGHEVDLNTVSWKLHADHEVRYWKRLPNVHVATFQAWQSDSARDCRLSPALWIETWSRTRFDWYRKPWDLEGWPPSPESG